MEGKNAFQVVGLQLQSKSHQGDFRYVPQHGNLLYEENVSRGTLRYSISLLSKG